MNMDLKYREKIKKMFESQDLEIRSLGEEMFWSLDPSFSDWRYIVLYRSISILSSEI